MYIKVRGDERVQSKAVLIACGINEAGYRQVLGLAVGDSESASTWGDFLKALKARGLCGVDWVISDDHEGLKGAVNRHLQGAAWQRCQVHLMRNVLEHTPHKLKAEVGEALKLVLYSRNSQEARTQLQAFISQFEGKAANAVKCLEDGFEEATAVFALPSSPTRSGKRAIHARTSWPEWSAARSAANTAFRLSAGSTSRPGGSGERERPGEERGARSRGGPGEERRERAGQGRPGAGRASEWGGQRGRKRARGVGVL